MPQRLSPLLTNFLEIYMKQNIDFALDYASRGLAVFPIREKAKTPLTQNGFHDATIKHTQIQTWWRQYPNANIGIATGKVSQIWVLDIDGEQGELSLHALEKINGKLPSSLEVISGGGGRHIYFNMPFNATIKCNAGVIGKGLDVRGDGGYIIAPPSMHPSGKHYEWLVDSAHEISYAPEWLINLVCQKNSPTKAQNIALDWAEFSRGVDEGGRNDALTRLSGKLLGYRLDPYLCLYLLSAWNEARCNPPLPNDEVIKTYLSIAQKEAVKRGVL